MWPAIPDTLEERQALERGETITRPEAPEKTVTAFDATVSGEAALSDTALTITLTFSEALRTGEYAVGMDIAEAWETAWNADGTQMTLTVPADELRGAMKNIRAYERFGGEAKCTGVHLEGPFVSRGKCGAQNPDNIRKPDIALFNELNELSGGMVRLITVAPEVEGALDFIREASKVCTVSLGHSTADYDQAMAGFEAGATHVTHLFNGMEPFHHRKPGLVGAALTAGANVELICDGVHIHPAMIVAVHKMFGDRLIIVSDSLRCAGLCDGRYNLGGLPMIVRDGRATLLDGTIAGSSSNLLQELRNVVSYGVPLEAAVKAMTETPAKNIGVFDSIGSLETGKCADFLVLNKDLKLMATFIDGKLVNGTTDFESVK